MRIDKFVAEQTGISRSDAKELIKRRKITVNGASVTSADMHVDPEKDENNYRRKVHIIQAVYVHYA